MRRAVGKRRGFWIAVVAAAVFYTLFASPPAGKEPQLRALAALKLPEPIELKEPPRKAEAGWLYFSDMENFGLVSPGTGVVESCYRLIPHAACDGTHLVNVFPERGSMDIYSLAEGRKVEAPFNGYPFLEASRIFLIRPDQQGLSEIDGNGGTIWSREFGSILTCASATAGHSVWGTLGGEIVVQNGLGEFATIEPSSFGISLEKACVYSIAISPDGETIAALYGLDPQYALFFESKGGTYNLVQKVKLESQTTKAEQAIASADGAYVVMRTASGLLVYSVRDRTSSLVQSECFGGETEVGMKTWGKESIAMLSASREGKHLSIVRRGVLEANFKVDDDATSIFAPNDKFLLVSGGSTLRRYEMIGETE
jgi:hypothetical protein